MDFNILKKARVTLAICFVVILSLSYVDFPQSLIQKISRFAVSLQFVPSFIKALGFAGYSVFIVAVILVLTFLFGRIYCSILCPLGVFQDIISFISRKLKIKTRFKFRSGSPYLRYTLLGLTIACITGNIITVLTYLDPFSIYSRFAGYIAKPIVIFLNNSVAAALAKGGFNSLLDTLEFTPVPVYVFAVNIVLLILILVMSFTRGRLYCNTICPVGTFLGLISKFSIFKISIDKSSCTRCGKCMQVCKSECIDVKNFTIDHSRCVSCLNCVSVCPEKSTVLETLNKRLNNIYKIPAKKATGNLQKVDTSKRNFLLGSVAASASLVFLLHPFRSFAISSMTKKTPVTPPGSVSTVRFNSLCTGCSICISHCPTKVLRPAVLEYGLIGMMQPTLCFDKSFCEYDCVVCGERCPTGAIKPFSVEAKHLNQIGIARYELANCIVETNQEKCTKCFDHCPVNAIDMVEGKNRLPIPHVTDKVCIGCGECEFVCPAAPVKAMRIMGNPVHQLAVKVSIKKSGANEDFPF